MRSTSRLLVALTIMAALAAGSAKATTFQGTYYNSYVSTGGLEPSYTDQLSNPFTENLVVGIPTAPTGFFAITPPPDCAFCNSFDTANPYGTATGTVFFFFLFTEPTVAGVAEDSGQLTASYYADASNNTDSIVWNSDTIVANFADGEVLDIILSNASGAGGTLFPQISFDLVSGPTVAQSVPEPATIALMGTGLIGLRAVRRRRQRG